MKIVDYAPGPILPVAPSLSATLGRRLAMLSILSLVAAAALIAALR